MLCVPADASPYYLNKLSIRKVEMDIAPKTIEFDEKNPRGETSEQIENSERFKKLKASIERHGILVPLVVRKNTSNSFPYKLVDGERRLRAALKAGLKQVPVHVVTSDEADGRILAYQVHELREPWTKVMELNAIREIYNELRLKNKLTPEDLFKELLDITGHKDHELKDLLILLKYDDVTIEKVQAGDVAMSYLIQIDSSFISPLKREFPELYLKYGDMKLREILVKKAENGKIGNTRYLMDNVLQYFNKKETKKKFKKELDNFLTNAGEDISKAIGKLESTKSGAVGKTRYTRKRTKNSPVKETALLSQLDDASDLIKIEEKVLADGVLNLVFEYLRDAISRFEEKSSQKFASELELQNFIYAVLRSIFSSIEREDTSRKMCGKSTKPDFILKNHNVVIEVKYVRDKEHSKKVADEITVDVRRYLDMVKGAALIAYIYDPNNFIDNRQLWKKELKILLPELHSIYVQP